MRIVVAGQPTTQGSAQAFVRGDRAVIVQGGSADRRRRLGDWRQAIRSEAQRVLEEADERPLEGPVILDVTFALRAPANRPKRRRTWPVGARSGDLDKLLRAVLDGLTGVAFADDSQVVWVTAGKDWAANGWTGCVIELEPAPPGLVVLPES